MENATLNKTTNATSDDASSPAETILIHISTGMILLFGSCGVIGNSLTLRLILPQVKKKGIYLMFVLLAVCDLVVIVVGMVHVSAMNLSGGMVNMLYLTDCGVLFLIAYLGSELSSWLLVLITIDRICICYFPHQDYFSPRRVVLYVGCISTVLLGINFPYLGGLRSDIEDTSFEACSGRNVHINYYYSVLYPKIEFSVYCLVPAALLVVLNAILLRKVKVIKSQVSPTQMNVNSNNMELQNMEGQNRPAPLPTPVTIQAARSVKTILRLCKATAILSLTFILFMFPVVIVYLMSYSPAISTKFGTDLYEALNGMYLLSFLNHCINCVLYCLSGRTYRQQLLKLVRCKRN